RRSPPEADRRWAQRNIRDNNNQILKTSRLRRPVAHGILRHRRIGKETVMDVTESAATWLDLYDWRARVASMYRERNVALQAGEDAQVVVERFRAAKDALFKQHPQTPLGKEDRATFSGLRYFDYDPTLRVEAELQPIASEEQVEVPSSGQEVMRF